MHGVAQPACRPAAAGDRREGALDQSQAQFTAATAASRFSDRQAFLAALLDDETVQRLTQLKQTLEQQRQQATALCEQATRQQQAHRRCVRKGRTRTSPPCKPSCTPGAAAAGQHHPPGEIRQQLRQDTESRQHQQALGRQIAEAAQRADDWGYLNSLIGSSTGDRFRKFAGADAG